MCVCNILVKSLTKKKKIWDILKNRYHYTINKSLISSRKIVFKLSFIIPIIVIICVYFKIYNKYSN